MVVFPESTDDVVKIVKIAIKYRMPVVPYSGATSLEGHFRAVRQTCAHSLATIMRVRSLLYNKNSIKPAAFALISCGWTESWPSTVRSNIFENHILYLSRVLWFSKRTTLTWSVSQAWVGWS